MSCELCALESCTMLANFMTWNYYTSDIHHKSSTVIHSTWITWQHVFYLINWLCWVHANAVVWFQIPVRPFRHDEYERFITAAYPYYGACFSMVHNILVDLHLYFTLDFFHVFLMLFLRDPFFQGGFVFLGLWFFFDFVCEDVLHMYNFELINLIFSFHECRWLDSSSSQ